MSSERRVKKMPRSADELKAGKTSDPYWKTAHVRPNSKRKGRIIIDFPVRERVLGCLSYGLWINFSDLMELTGTGHTQLATILNTLEKEGIVERKVGDRIKGEGRSILYRENNKTIKRYEKKYNNLSKLIMFKLPEDTSNNTLLLADVNYNNLLTNEEITIFQKYLKDIELGFDEIKTLLNNALERKRLSLPGRPNSSTKISRKLSPLADYLCQRSANMVDDSQTNRALKKYLEENGHSITELEELNIENPDPDLIRILEIFSHKHRDLPLSVGEKKLFDQINPYKPIIGENEDRLKHNSRIKELGNLEGKRKMTLILYDDELEHIYRKILEP